MQLEVQGLIRKKLALAAWSKWLLDADHAAEQKATLHPAAVRLPSRLKRKLFQRILPLCIRRPSKEPRRTQSGHWPNPTARSQGRRHTAARTRILSVARWANSRSVAASCAAAHASCRCSSRAGRLGQGTCANPRAREAWATFLDPRRRM